MLFTNTFLERDLKTLLIQLHYFIVFNKIEEEIETEWIVYLLKLSFGANLGLVSKCLPIWRQEIFVVITVSQINTGRLHKLMSGSHCTIVTFFFFF